MAKFSIISKDGESVRLSGYPKYTGTFLGVSFLEFMSIESPTLIDWEIGDYIDYDRTGLRYKLYTLPIPKKQARAGSHGASFVYSNVKFYAETKDLEIAPFRDLVPEDNNIHFSTRPDVSTYENVYGLARRIQACMDDVFPGKWRIEVYDTDDTKLLETLNETKDFSISNSNCLQTLSQIYEKWDNIGWIHSYDSAQNVHVITIGRASIRDNENTSDVFAYGLGNGLTSIKKASNNEDEFATRLYVYGSDRNIQTRYYKQFDILNAESVDIRNLMLPISTWGKTDGLPDARKAYLEADQSIIEKYGLIPRTVYFDGSQNEAIYPSIQGLKMSQVREEMIAAGEGNSEHLPPALDIRIDRTGSILLEIGNGSKEEVESNRTFVLSMPMVGFNIEEQGLLTSEGMATISIKSGPCAGREFKVKSYWGYTIGLPNGYHAYELYRSWDESLGMGFPNTTYPINEGDEFVLLDIPMPDYYITLAEKRLLEAGQKKLAECTKVNPYYEPAIDPIKIKESGKALREGMYMQISDADIIDTEDGKDYVLIDTLTIDEKAEIPKYNVTLRKQKKTSKSFAALESRVGASEKSLSTLTTEKAGKTDTYSKANIDNLLKKYLLLEAASQTVKGDLVFDGNLLVKGDILSEGQFAAATIGIESGGSAGATYLADLFDVSLNSLVSGDILSWNGSEWVNIKQSSLVPDLSAYASKSFVSDALEGYLPKSGGTISGSLQIGNDDNTAYNYLRLVREGYEMYVNCNAYGGYISYGAIGAANAQLRLVSDSITFNGNTLIHSENIGDYSFVPKSDNLISNVNADNYLSNGVYLNQTGNGSGNSNFPQSYSIFATFAQSEQYLAQLSIGYNSFYFRRKIDTWDEWREVIHSGNYSEYALPLSGGILRDSWSGGTEIRRSDSNNGYASLIFSQSDGTILGRFGFGGVDNPLFITQSGAYKTLIHSGNIGSQSVSYASNAGLLGGLSKADFYKGDMGVIPTVGNLAALDTGCYWVYENLGEASSVPSTYSSLVAFGKSYYSSQMCVMHNASRAWLRGVYNSSSGVSASEWHELAFTDSNVAGATRLVTPSGGHVIHLTDYTLYIGDSVYPTRTTNLLGKEIVLRYGANAANGLILNPSGNVTIGAGDFASTTTKLYVDGGIRFAPRTIWGQSFDGTSGVSGTMRYVSTIHFATYDNGSYGIYQGNWYAEGLSNRDLALHFDKVHFSGNVLIGSTTDNGAKLQVAGDVRIGAPNLPSNLVVNGNTRICRRYDDRTYLDIICEDVFVNYEAYDTDGFCSHVFKSNGSDILTLYGFDNSATFWGSVLVSDTLTAQNGITTNEITIGGIKLDVYNGALRVNGDIFSTGQFAASVAGEATGGSNIILDYASIVNALGYTPANNNNLAQVAFTGSYSSLSGTPDVYTKADVYNKNEINQKLAGVGGGGGSVGSTFGIDYINGQSFDMPNGVNCITSYNDATVDFSSIVPADPSLPCIVYIVKCDYHTLQVTSGCNIVSVNSSGDEVIDFSINGMTGMMLVWEPDYWRWFAYLQK